VDGAWDNSSSFAGSGVIIRDSLGNFIAGSSIIHKVSSAIEAEAFALVDGIQLAVQLNQDNVILESDSVELLFFG
jgi:ribonuclease HI